MKDPKAIIDRNSFVKGRLDNMFKGLKTPTFSGWKLEDRYTYNGLSISIENKRGSKRQWKDRNGNSGETLMIHDYGYIRNTVGNDGDHIDCYVNKEVDSDIVFIVHQVVPTTGKFDEDKVMLGFQSASQAKAAYQMHYDSPKHFGSITQMSIDDFKKKVIGKVVKKVQ